MDGKKLRARFYRKGKEEVGLKWLKATEEKGQRGRGSERKREGGTKKKGEREKLGRVVILRHGLLERDHTQADKSSNLKVLKFEKITRFFG
jgi:hypothetical protein